MALKRPRWRGFSSVVCGCDFSDQSRLALHYAARLARRGSARLHVAHANHPLLVAAAAAALHDRNIARRSAGELESFVNDTLGEREAAALTIKIHAAVGAPADVLLNVAARARAGIVVAGTHGLTGADRVVVGSTTLGLLQRSNIPVLAVPRPAATIAAPADSWPGSEITAAIELDAAAGDEAMNAAILAEWFGSWLTLVHVIDEIPVPRWFEGDLSEVERHRTVRAQKQLDKLAAAARARVTTDTQIVHGPTAEAIGRFAASTRSGLIVTALRDRRGWFGSRRGSISYHVLTHAAVPVLACPPRWRLR